MTTTTRRDWTTIGEPYTKLRPDIEQAIGGLSWRPAAGDGPIAPVLAVNATVAELNIPGVQQIALNGGIEGGSGENAYGYGVYGIEATGYSNVERIRLYVLDVGTAVIPICTDVFE